MKCFVSAFVLFAFCVLPFKKTQADFGMPSVPRAPFIMPVYGADDRQDIYEVMDPQLLLLAESTVALVMSEKLKFNRSTQSYSFISKSLSERKNLCASEPYVNQPSLARCSGALVGPDLVLTAGHCVATQKECDAYSVVFDFSIRNEGEMPTAIPAKSVYKCSRIMGRDLQFDPHGVDFALIKLDRRVTDRSPLAIDRGAGAKKGNPLVVIGHPSGLPTKVAGGARVLDASEDYQFVANIDSFHGNSGSPVFNAHTGLIEGILVFGEADYGLDEEQGCQVNRHCNDSATGAGCHGERSTRISYAAPFIPRF
jgi:hypothetical protein